MHDTPVPASWRIALPHTVAAVPVARALVRTALAEREHAADSDTAELLTAELVANAVEHTAGDGPIELVVELMPTGCRVEVHDPDPEPPLDLTLPHPPGEPDPGRSTGAACCCSAPSARPAGTAPPTRARRSGSGCP